LQEELRAAMAAENPNAARWRNASPWKREIRDEKKPYFGTPRGEGSDTSISVVAETFRVERSNREGSAVGGAAWDEKMKVVAIEDGGGIRLGEGASLWLLSRGREWKRKGKVG